MTTENVQRIPHPNRKRGRGRPKTRKPPRKMTISKRLLETRHKEKTPGVKIYNRKAKRLGMLKSANRTSLEEIHEVIADCQEATYSLCVPSFLIRAFDEDIQKAAVMSFLLYMEYNLSQDGEMFVVKYPEVTITTGVKRIKLGNIMKSFREYGLIETKQMGVPAYQHYKINKDLLVSLMMERVLGYKDPIDEVCEVVV